jgi:hypothetical protein
MTLAGGRVDQQGVTSRVFVRASVEDAPVLSMTRRALKDIDPVEPATEAASIAELRAGELAGPRSSAREDGTAPRVCWRARIHPVAAFASRRSGGRAMVCAPQLWQLRHSSSAHSRSSNRCFSPFVPPAFAFVRLS